MVLAREGDILTVAPVTQGGEEHMFLWQVQQFADSTGGRITT